jgi:class 3 adenylate cyclase
MLQVKHPSKEESDSASRIKKISEILGMLTETRRGREWLIKEVKRHGLKLSEQNVLNSYELLNYCPDSFVDKLHRALTGENVSGFEVQSLTKTYHWLFSDIVDGANPTVATKDQVRKIVTLNQLIERTETFRNRDSSSTVILPVGDGVAIGFGDSPEKPLRLAIEMHRALHRYNQSRPKNEQLFIRIGIDMGPVYFVKDLTGKDNVWGSGIILTRRVMDLCGPMNIFTSARVAQDVRKLSPEYEKILHPIGNYSIKHGEELSIYNIYGVGFGNKVAPRKAKIGVFNLERDIRTVNNFSFVQIDVGLEILNQKDALTRHTWFWKVINTSKEPMGQVFYSLDGDIPKEFGDMNVKVKDDHDNNFEILSVNVNKPYHKEFNIQLNRTIKPKQQKIIILSYDWEEPERNYFYNFAAGCETFNFLLTVPKEMDIIPTIFKVDAETGNKIDVTTSSNVDTIGNKKIIRWSRNDLMADEAYQFTW